MCVLGISLLVAALATQSPAGIALPAGSVDLPGVGERLDLLRTSRWISAGASRSELPLARVRDHFRREERRSGDTATPRLRGRLREWLERNPIEMEKYREFERAQSSAPVNDWEIRSLPVAEIPLHLGGGEALRGRRFAGRTVSVSFGTILLPDSVLRVQLLSPYPSEDGRELLRGTLVVWIREARDDAPLSATPAAETVDGPETSGLARRIPGGWLVMDEPVGGMIAVGVPSLSRSDVRPRGTAASVVHALAGPDRQGTIAYIENRASEGRHALKTVRIDGGPEKVVFSRPGEAFFEMAVGSSMALSPAGGRVALISKLTRFQTNRPAFPLRIGTLEIWDLEKGSGQALDLFPLDRRLAWFPDGKRVAYVELVPLPKAIFPRGAGEDGFGAAFRSWEAVPVVRVLEADTDRRKTLHVGWDPVVSSDGRSVLVRDSENRWRLVDAETGGSRPVGWPGDAGGAIALIGDGLVVYWGLPTSGSAPDYTRTYSAAIGPRAMKTIKVAELATQRFETLLPSLDPRREISFGMQTAR